MSFNSGFAREPPKHGTLAGFVINSGCIVLPLLMALKVPGQETGRHLQSVSDPCFGSHTIANSDTRPGGVDEIFYRPDGFRGLFSPVPKNRTAYPESVKNKWIIINQIAPAATLNTPSLLITRVSQSLITLAAETPSRIIMSPSLYRKIEDLGSLASTSPQATPQLTRTASVKFAHLARTTHWPDTKTQQSRSTLSGSSSWRTRQAYTTATQSSATSQASPPVNTLSPTHGTVSTQPGTPRPTPTAGFFSPQKTPERPGTGRHQRTCQDSSATPELTTVTSEIAAMYTCENCKKISGRLYQLIDCGHRYDKGCIRDILNKPCVAEGCDATIRMKQLFEDKFLLREYIKYDWDGWKAANGLAHKAGSEQNVRQSLITRVKPTPDATPLPVPTRTLSQASGTTRPAISSPVPLPSSDMLPVISLDALQKALSTVIRSVSEDASESQQFMNRLELFLGVQQQPSAMVDRSFPLSSDIVTVCSSGTKPVWDALLQEYMITGQVIEGLLESYRHFSRVLRQAVNELMPGQNLKIICARKPDDMGEIQVRIFIICRGYTGQQIYLVMGAHDIHDLTGQARIMTAEKAINLQIWLKTVMYFFGTSTALIHSDHISGESINIYDLASDWVHWETMPYPLPSDLEMARNEALDSVRNAVASGFGLDRSTINTGFPLQVPFSQYFHRLKHAGRQTGREDELLEGIESMGLQRLSPKQLNKFGIEVEWSSSEQCYQLVDPEFSRYEQTAGNMHRRTIKSLNKMLTHSEAKIIRLKISDTVLYILHEESTFVVISFTAGRNTVPVRITVDKSALLQYLHFLLEQQQAEEGFYAVYSSAP